MTRFITEPAPTGSPTRRNVVLTAAVFAASLAGGIQANAASPRFDYRLLATSKTSTMEKELNEAAAAGYRFSKAMGGKTANGGQEVAIVVVKSTTTQEKVSSTYKLVATTFTSTMQKELQALADAGYEYLDQTVFESAFGGKEVVVIMERDITRARAGSKYRLLATTRTSTMEQELKDAGDQGYVLVGFTIGKTAVGGDELVSILKKD